MSCNKSQETVTSAHFKNDELFGRQEALSSRMVLDLSTEQGALRRRRRSQARWRPEVPLQPPAHKKARKWARELEESDDLIDDLLLGPLLRK
jgi:hypothetical protein